MADSGAAIAAIDDPERRCLPGNNTSVQEDGTVSAFAQFEDNPDLTKKQVQLLKEISDSFSPGDNAADLGILYEITGFKADSENFEFWEQYRDFEELGDDKLVGKGRDEQERKGGKKKNDSSSDSSTD